VGLKDKSPLKSLKKSLKVVSFNIRYDTEKDTENNWENRKHLLLEVLKLLKPDIIGMQEALYNQLSYINDNLPNYDYIGVGREDGKTKGEFTPIFYRNAIFTKIKEGHFWLSETPEIPGSKSWDSTLPRVVSWVKLRIKDSDTKHREIYFVNTHLEHRSEKARNESAKLLSSFIRKLEEEAPVILTGDFNTGPTSPTYRLLTETLLKDTFIGNNGTSHGFTGIPNSSRIDWILVSKQFKKLSFEIVKFNRNNKYPSDHFPVVAVLNID